MTEEIKTTQHQLDNTQEATDVADAELHRKLKEPTDIRIEVEVRGALDLFKQTGDKFHKSFSAYMPAVIP